MASVLNVPRAGPFNNQAVPGPESHARGPARHGPAIKRATAGRAGPGTISTGWAVPCRAGPFGQVKSQLRGDHVRRKRRLLIGRAYPHMDQASPPFDFLRSNGWHTIPNCRSISSFFPTPQPPASSAFLSPSPSPVVAFRPLLAASLGSESTLWQVSTPRRPGRPTPLGCSVHD